MARRNLRYGLLVLVPLCMAMVAPAGADVCRRSSAPTTASDALRILQASAGATSLPACPRGSLPSTGQTSCYDGAGFEIACAGTGQDGAIRAGAQRVFLDDGNGTIIDPVTGLMWEAKCSGAYCPWLHDKDVTYDWDAAFAVHALALNNAAFAGHTDWRIPNIFEAATLVDAEKPWEVRAADLESCWPNCWQYPPVTFDAFDDCGSDSSQTECSCTGRASCALWSSTSVWAPNGIFAIDLGLFGSQMSWNWKVGRANVRAVRSIEASTDSSAHACRRNDTQISATEALRWLRASVGIGDIQSCTFGQMPSTGQMSCWDPTSGSEIPCAGTGHDGEVRAGLARDFVNNADGTITERTTGLVWEVKCDGPSCPTVHDKDTMHTWDGAFDHVRTLNEQHFAGYDDWRVPNEIELLVLWNLGREKFGPHAATFAAFDQCAADCDVTDCSCTGIAAHTWSSTSAYYDCDPSNGEGNWCGAKVLDLNAFHASVGLRMHKNHPGYVRAVRGGL